MHITLQLSKNMMSIKGFTEHDDKKGVFMDVNSQVGSL